MRGKKAKQLKRLIRKHRKMFEDDGHKLPGNKLVVHPSNRTTVLHHPDSPRMMERHALKKWGKGVPLPKSSAG